jgi:hypothetical protein
LSVAIRALLDFAAWNVKLPLGHAAVMAGRHAGSPTEAFVSISGSSEQFRANWIVRQRLRKFDFCSRLWSHGETCITNRGPREYS